MLAAAPVGCVNMLHKPVPTLGTLPDKVALPTLWQMLWSEPAFAVVTGVTQAPQLILVTVADAVLLQVVALLVTVTL